MSNETEIHQQETEANNNEINNNTLASENSEIVKEPSEIEKKAMEMGWDPNHQGKTFVPAEEYVNRAPLFNKIEEQSKQIRELRNFQKQMAEHMSAVRKESYEQALKDLENKKLEAVTIGDVNKYQQMELEAQTIKTRMESDSLTKSVQPQIDPDISNWVQKNSSWYNQETVENKKMKAAAEAIDTFLTNQARIDQDTPKGQMPNINIKEHFKAVEKEVKRLFPHRFENMNREQPSAVGKSTTGITGKVSEKGLASRLTPEQRMIAERFHKSNPEYTPEKYAADLESIGRLNP